VEDKVFLFGGGEFAKVYYSDAWILDLSAYIYFSLWFFLLCYSHYGLHAHTAPTGVRPRMPTPPSLSVSILQSLRSFRSDPLLRSEPLISLLVAISHFLSSDVRILVQGREFRLHRLILSLRCNYFRLMFTCGLAESSAEWLTLHDITPEVPHSLCLFFPLSSLSLFV
jgi:hypothetical protein